MCRHLSYHRCCSLKARMKPKTINEFRKNLQIECTNKNSKRCRLKELCDGTLKRGQFRVLCVIKEVDEDSIVKSHCRNCKKIEKCDISEKENYCIVCKGKVSQNLMLTFTVFDQDKFETKLILKNKELLSCLGIATPSIKPQNLEEEIKKKVRSLKNKVAEFGVAKLSGRKHLLIYNSVVKS